MKQSAFFLTSFIFFTALIFNCVSHAMAQVPGCTDPLANNYNASATSNNGSCTYNVTTYTPQNKIDPLNDTLIETSGLQWAGNSLWTFNDGGNAAAIYRIDTTSNKILQRVYLQGVTNIDWEDIAFDGTYFYIGDFGNNLTGGRQDLVIYKLPLTAIPDPGDFPVATIPAGITQTINFSYSDQVQPAMLTDPNKTNFDCEAMLIDSGQIHLFTKRWIDTTTTHYIINSVEPGTYIAQAMENYDTKYLVTAADKAPGQRVIILIGYQATGFAKHFMHLLSTYQGHNYFSGNKRRIDLPNIFVMGQAEGICFRNSTYGYISNEKFANSFVNITPKLKSFDISNLVSGIVTTHIFSGNGYWADAANWSDNNPPPSSVLGPGKQIIIDPLPGGSCILNTVYTIPAGSFISISNGKHLVIQGNLDVQ